MAQHQRGTALLGTFGKSLKLESQPCTYSIGSIERGGDVVIVFFLSLRWLLLTMTQLARKMSSSLHLCHGQQCVHSSLKVLARMRMRRTSFTLSIRGKNDPHIWCSLSEMRLSERHGEYIAISHTWDRDYVVPDDRQWHELFSTPSSTPCGSPALLHT
jgi:hypothetical protein